MNSTSNLSRIFLALSALVFFVIGASIFRDPFIGMAGTELQPLTVSAFNEVRANYGGLQIAIGLMLLNGAFRTHWRRQALWISVAVTGGLLGGRLISIGIDGLPNTFTAGLVWLEAIATIIATVLLWRTR
ncbi:DUF4345 domain-containing protein [Brucella anthropi]|uniref:DUF4345 domain-containing protein n=1 Tax=Brucella anthropi TaxID=529 RepID=UPI001CFE2F46|nr:DUF4345 domain-containing protein [Brucella anthropi]